MSGKRDCKIPYDGHGNMLHYPESWLMEPNPRYAADRPKGEWRTNEPFEATLKFDGYGRGRSAVVFYWKNEAGHRYPMFVSRLAELLERNVVEYGEVRDATWIAVKQGMNYSIELYKGDW